MKSIKSFRIGDRVKVKPRVSPYEGFDGLKGEVVNLSNVIGVKFDKVTPGGEARMPGKRHGWPFFPNELVKLKKVSRG